MSLFDIFKVKEYKARIAELENKLEALGYREYSETKAAIENMKREAEEQIRNDRNIANRALSSLNREIAEANHTISVLVERISTLQATAEKLDKQCKASQRKLDKSKELYRAIQYSISSSEYAETKLLAASQQEDLDELAPTVTLKLHCMDMKDLRKAYRENEKQIDNVVERYKSRYTTKANRTIYDLMVIALRAEIQNILYNLKYEKLDKGIENVKVVTAKYLAIATNGNQSIASTITKFIGEIEYLFINAVKIEYNYYVKKEQARQEQLAIREQMRQEAEERKALELERKRIEAEEQKYKNEIENLTSKMDTATEEEREMLQAEILKIEGSLSDVVLKKDEIIKLQNGKAGHIYIISNLGSFGENIFKIGMTRRQDPQDRVNELGSASVPFQFDVHSFIFSEDAVSLEAEMHRRLNDKRVNKVNMRKEFFYSSVDELEALTNEISPSAEFNRTMLAEQYRQSLSTTENYSTDYSLDDDIDEEEQE